GSRRSIRCSLLTPLPDNREIVIRFEQQLGLHACGVGGDSTLAAHLRPPCHEARDEPSAASVGRVRAAGVPHKRVVKDTFARFDLNNNGLMPPSCRVGGNHAVSIAPLTDRPPEPCPGRTRLIYGCQGRTAALQTVLWRDQAQASM